MRRTEALQGVRMTRFLDILGRYEAAEFSQLEAAELLGIGERTFRRWRQRFERPRRPMPGMMLHQDGSRHEWLGGQPALDLIVTLDDATSAILSAFLVDEEGTDSTFRGLAEVFGRHGLPLSLYTDRGSHHFYTPEAGP
jgi:Homeodomain-like domain